MRIPRFYQADTFQVGQSLELSPENFRHAIQVMRLRISSSLIIFNGMEGEYLAQLIDIKKKSATIEVISFDPVDRESPLSIQLVLALIKPDKMDFSIQKAVELGVNTIQPVSTERSVIQIKSSRLEKKMEHWRGVIHSACEQSGRTIIPALLPIVSFQDYLRKPVSALRIAMLPTASKTLDQLECNLEHNKESIDLLIGPEGGYTDFEETLLHENQITSITFGPRILRAETAVIAGLAVLQTRWGDCASRS